MSHRFRHRFFSWKAQRTGAKIIVLAAVVVGVWAIAAEVALWRGAACLEARRHKQAMAWLRLAQVISLRRAELHYLLARCHRRLGEFDDVQVHLSQALKLGWDVNQLEREEVLALAQTGHYDEVKPYWTTLFRDPGSDGPEICEAYVTAAFGLFRLNDAWEVLKGWEADYPDDPQPHVMRARLAETLHRWGEVATHYRQALQRAPDRTDVQFGLAGALMKLGKNDEAEDLLRRVIRSEPGNLAARLAYAQHMTKLDREDEARKTLQDILRQEPDNAEALLALGNLELASGQPTRSLQYLQRAFNLRPENCDVVYAYARALQAAGEVEESRWHFQFVDEGFRQLGRRNRLVEQILPDPDNVDLRFEVASITWQYKSPEDAEMWWRCLLTIDPDHRPTHAALADHYALMGDRERAAHHRRLAGDADHGIERMHALLNVRGSIPGGAADLTRGELMARLHEQAASPKKEMARLQSTGADPKPQTARAKQMPERSKTAAWFVDVAPQAGVQFVPRDGQEANWGSILETLGVGVALFDYDGDDDLDVFVPGGGHFGGERKTFGLPPALFRNEGDWQFTEVTPSAGVAATPFYSHAAVVGDYNNDGLPDLLVTGYGGLLLYRNNGDGTFMDVTRQAGLSTGSWNCGAAWGDLNSDGHPDLYVVRYVNWSFDIHPHSGPSREPREPGAPEEFEPISDVFFLGNGDGTFRNATAEVGLIEGGKGLSVISADLDLDGDLDYYVTNDTTPNLLYRNDGKGRLEEIGIFSGAALGETGGGDGSMGVDLGDFDLDGMPDLWVANFEDQSFALYRNLGDCIYQHVSARTGIARTRGVYVGFGTVFFDFDRDGDEDIFVSTGHVRYHAPNAPYRQLPLLLENWGGAQFTNVAAQAGPYTSAPHVGRGVAMGDVDRDGDVDLIVAHTNEPIAFLSNRSKSKRHWLRVRLIGLNSNRDCIGARVRIQTAAASQTRQIKGGSSYFSSHDPGLFFGLGKHAAIDRIEIAWPSGLTRTLANVKADQTIIVHERSP